MTGREVMWRERRAGQENGMWFVPAGRFALWTVILQGVDQPAIII